MTFNDVRKIGLKLPRAEESRYHRMPALKVDGEIFVLCTSHPSADSNSVSVGFKRCAELIARDPAVFYLKAHYGPYPGVLVPLDLIARAAVVPGRQRV
jgi:hypothetical protein